MFQERKAKKLFTALTKFQLKFHFKRLARFRSELPFNNFMDSDIAGENSLKNERVRLPPISMKGPANQLQSSGIYNGFHQEKRDDISIERIESPGLMRTNNLEKFRKEYIVKFYHIFIVFS